MADGRPRLVRRHAGQRKAGKFKVGATGENPPGLLDFGAWQSRFSVSRVNGCPPAPSHQSPSRTAFDKPEARSSDQVTRVSHQSSADLAQTLFQAKTLPWHLSLTNENCRSDER